MSADNRKVTTDALETLGNIIGTSEARDAIHLAVEPVEAATRLAVGAHVELRDGKAYAAAPGEGVGVVDPFLMDSVKKGERFWLVVYPRQITSLRHVWTHPAFPAAEGSAQGNVNKATSEAWLRDFIARSDCPDYEEVIATALNNRDTWDSKYLHFNGSDAHGDIPPEFWTHIEIVTGRSIPQEDRAEYFSCSC